MYCYHTVTERLLLLKNAMTNDDKRRRRLSQDSEIIYWGKKMMFKVEKVAGKIWKHGEIKIEVETQLKENTEVQLLINGTRQKIPLHNVL